MRKSARLPILILAWCVSASVLPGPAHGQEPDRSVADVFRAAAEAYDEGRLEEADALYRQLHDRGIRAPELAYNRGNVQFRLGRVGQAIAHYRQALVRAPRDTEIRANLEFARERAGAVEPDAGLWERAALLAPGEWAALAILALWTLCLALAAALLRPAARRAAVRVAVIAVCLLALGGTGFAYWLSRAASPEVVITESVPALYAPLDEAEPHFALPAGTVVRHLEESAGWHKVRLQDKQGWIPKSAAAIVRPW